MKRVSFDFDSTLSRKDVQVYATKLKSLGFDLWVCTIRFDETGMPHDVWNDDLFEVTDKLGIPREQIIFTIYADKCEFLDDSYLFHLDDDSYEIDMLRIYGHDICILITKDNDWEQ